MTNIPRNDQNTTFEPDTTVNFKPIIKGTCECGMIFVFGTVDNKPTLLHQLPICDTFNRFESPIDFMTHMHQKIKDT